jgi:hypothetical protein
MAIPATSIFTIWWCSMKKGDLVFNEQHGRIGILVDRRVTDTGFVILSIYYNGEIRPYTEHHWEVLKKV